MIESEHTENEQHRECEYKERGFHGFHPSILMDRWILGDTGWEVKVIIPNGVVAVYQILFEGLNVNFLK